MMRIVPPPSGMTAEQFVFWLQGFVELKEFERDKTLTITQWDTIKQHLGLVFQHQGGPVHDNKVPADRSGFQRLDFPRRDLDKILVC